MHLRQPVASLIGLLAIALAAGGCVLLESASESASASSDSASAVMESFSDSSESSSGEEEEEVLYQDVRDYTELHARTGGSVAGYLAGLGELCNAHALSNWQAEVALYREIGDGLGRAQVDATRLAAYSDAIAGDDGERRDAIQAGYDTRR